jgi:hypothetical protein
MAKGWRHFLENVCMQPLAECIAAAHLILLENKSSVSSQFPGPIYYLSSVTIFAYDNFECIHLCMQSLAECIL